MSLAIITASFGGMDARKAFPQQRDAPPFDLIEVTEDNSPLPFPGMNARMKAKFFKIQAHRIYHGYDTFIWVDGNVQIKSDRFVADLLAGLDGNQIAIAKHPCRKCIYEEADFIANSINKGSSYLKARYSAADCLENAKIYRESGHPPDWGLFWCGLFARRVDEATNRFFDEWWAHCLSWPTAIDQNSFAVLARRMDVKMGIMDWGNFYDNSTYNLVQHLRVQ